MVCKSIQSKLRIFSLRIINLSLYIFFFLIHGEKLLLKVMHYNIALLPKKVLITLLSYVLWHVMCYVTFELLLKIWAGHACLF